MTRRARRRVGLWAVKTSSPWATRRSHRCEPKNPAPPVTRTRLATTLMALPASGQRPQLGRRTPRRAADAEIREARRGHLLRLVDVAQIDYQRARQQGFDAAQIERAELIPFSQQDQRIGALHRLVSIPAIDQLGHKLFRLVHALWVKPPDARPLSDQPRQDFEARGIAHI